MIAIPDFSAGAMENWGLITYREALLLYDPNVTSSSHKSSIASVIAHELAHQWFGNLVTMKWWTDLWLNEGFATYMASLAVHHQFPEWNSFEESVASNLLAVFQLDALKTSHPVCTYYTTAIGFCQYAFRYLFRSIIQTKLTKFSIQFLIKRVRSSCT